LPGGGWSCQEEKFSEKKKKWGRQGPVFSVETWRVRGGEVRLACPRTTTSAIKLTVILLVPRGGKKVRGSCRLRVKRPYRRDCLLLREFTKDGTSAGALLGLRGQREKNTAKPGFKTMIPENNPSFTY